MRLIFVVLHLGKSFLEVVLQNGAGKRRRIRVQWIGKVQTDVPPANWFETAEGEFEYQDSEDAARAQGRALIR